MNTMARVKEIADNRDLTMFQLAQVCGIPYTTLRKTAARNGQLTVDTIEKICVGLHIPMSAFFDPTERCVK